jgi:hypothetical protein
LSPVVAGLNGGGGGVGDGGGRTVGTAFALELPGVPGAPGAPGCSGRGGRRLVGGERPGVGAGALSGHQPHCPAAGTEEDRGGPTVAARMPGDTTPPRRTGVMSSAVGVQVLRGRIIKSSLAPGPRVWGGDRSRVRSCVSSCQWRPVGPDIPEHAFARGTSPHPSAAGLSRMRPSGTRFMLLGDTPACLSEDVRLHHFSPPNLQRTR